MVDLIRKGVEFLRKFQKENLTESVQYVVPESNLTITDVLMTVGRENVEADGDLGIIVNSRAQDFLVDPNDLVDPAGTVNGGAPIPPKRGHQIIRTMTDIDGVKTQNLTYEVMGDEGEPPSRQSSRYNLNIRIHTKRIDFELKAIP